MRKRSNAVHAPSFDEYRTVSIAKQAEPVQSSSSPYVVSSLTRSLRDARPENLNPQKQKMKADPDLWKEFNFAAKSEYQRDCESLESESEVSTAQSSYCGSPVSLSPNGLLSKVSTKTATIMVVGTQQAGILGLLNGMFEDQPLTAGSSVNKEFDLVIKEHETNDQQYKLKFWIHDPSSQKHEAIVNVYYKTIQYYVFVYRPDNRESFECLVQTIEKIKSKVNGAKFAGMLVRDMTNLESGKALEVSEEEAERLRQKYAFTSEVMSSETASEARQQVLKMINRQSESKPTAEFFIKPCLVEQSVV